MVLLKFDLNLLSEGKNINFNKKVFDGTKKFKEAA